MFTPKEAAAQLGMTRTAISKCVAAGAPVHRWGPSGFRYKIDLEEFTAWMHQHGEEHQQRRKAQAEARAVQSLADMQKKRAEIMAALGG